MATARLEDIEDQSSPSASGRASLADIDDPNAPGAKEVEQAVRSVPRPQLDYMQTEQTLRSPIPQAPTPVAPESEQFQKDVQAGVNGKKRQPVWKTALGIATEAATNPSMTTGGPSTEGGKGAQVEHNIEQLQTPGERARGALGLAEAGTEAATPLMGPASLESIGATKAAIEAAPTFGRAALEAVKNPMIRGLAEGAAASGVAGKVAEKSGASKETQDYIENLAFWAPGVARSLTGYKESFATNPEGTQSSATASVFGGKAGVGVAKTPGSYDLGVRVGPFKAGVSVPRAAGPEPAAELQEPIPDISAGDAAFHAAQTVEPEPHPAAAAQSIQNEELQAARMASGLPPVEPPPPAPAPPAPPKVHEIGQADIAEIAGMISSVPEELRAQTVVEAHDTLTRVLLQQGKVVGPDGTLEVIRSPQDADRIAQKLVNAAQDYRLDAEGKKSPSGESQGSRKRDQSRYYSASTESRESGASRGNGQQPTSDQGLSDHRSRSPLPVSEEDHGTSAEIGQTSGEGGTRSRTAARKDGTDTFGPEVPSGSSETHLAGATVGSPRSGEGSARIEDIQDEGDHGAERPSSEGAYKQPQRSGEAGGRSLQESSQTDTGEESQRFPQQEVGGRSSASSREPLQGGASQSSEAFRSSPKSLAKSSQSGRDEQLGQSGQASRESTTIGPDGQVNRDNNVESGSGGRGKTVATVEGSGNAHISEVAPKTTGQPQPTSQAAKATQWQKGDRITLKDGSEGTVQYSSPSMRIVRAVDDDGKKLTISGKDVDQLQAAPKFKFGSTQANIPEDSEAHTALQAARERIPEADLAGKGKETESHVTVRYGIKGGDTSKIKRFISEQEPFEATLGKTEKFEPTEHSDGAAVIQAPIEAPELHRLNAELEKHGEFKKSDFDYRPHATIAYVKPEVAHRYVGMDVTHGKKFTVKSIAITDRNGNQEEVPLKGKTSQKPISSEGEKREVVPAKAQSAKGELEPGQVGEMKVGELQLAPHRFQYKLGTDTEGVSTLLKGVKKFQPDLAGIISVWKDPADGKFYVINGHHRFELAKRTGQKTAAVRHIQAADAAEARAVGARQNIAEGRGTPIDAAKFFRETGITPEKLEEHGISLGEATARKGMALANLDQALFNKVVAGELALGRAVAIGEATQDHAEQKAILDLVNKKEARGQKISDGVLSELVRFVKQSGQQTETTADLFGIQEVSRSLALEKAEVSDYIKQQLAKDKRLFGFVAKTERAKELERAGNVIDVGKSKAISEGAAQAEEVYNRLSGRGGELATVLDEAAKQLADGKPAGTVKSEAYQRVRAAVQKILGTGNGQVSERLEAGTGRREAAKGNAGEPEGSVNLYSTEPYKWPDFTVDNKAYQQALADIGKGKTFAELSADERHKVYAEAQRLKEQMLGKKTDNLFSPEAPAIRDRSPQAWAKIADFAYATPEKPEGVRPYVRVNAQGLWLISRAIRHNILGASVPESHVDELSSGLDEIRDMVRPVNEDAARNIERLKQDILSVRQPHTGVTIVPDRGGLNAEQDLRVLHEELIHAELQHAPGKGVLGRGVPAEMINDPGIQKMRHRIEMETRTTYWPEITIAEGAADLLTGTPHELTPEEAEASAAKYYEAGLEMHGPEWLDKAQQLFDYVDHLAREGGIIRPEEKFNDWEHGNAPARRALEAVRKKIQSRNEGNAERRGDQAQEGSGGIQKGGKQGTSLEAPAGSSPPSRAPNELPSVSRREGYEPRPPEGTPTNLASTQPVGLTDDELADWSKSKGFRVEPAGEQLGMFGGNDQVMRVFRLNRGKEQAGLVYQSQLDSLQQKQNAAPDEPFQLTGGEAREEQPRLFGMGDLGEIIGPTGQKKPEPGEGGGSFSLFNVDEHPENIFTDDRGTFEPGKIREYLDAQLKDLRGARRLESGMFDLEKRHDARVLRAKQLIEAANKKYGKQAIADYEQIYHHLEDPDHTELTARQDEILDQVVLPVMEQNDQLYQQLKQEDVPIENYVHRVVKGKGGWFDRIVAGAKGTGKGNLLSKSAPQTKGRTMMAIEYVGQGENEQRSLLHKPGERMVVSVKGGQVTAWINGKPENLGGISRTEEGKVFEDKDGSIWRLTQATTKEIEKHTELTYYHNALASALVSNLQLAKALDAAKFVESFKNSPEFHDVAFKEGQGNPPRGWRITQLPQFRGYYFEPHYADVLDRYAQRLQTTPSALDQVGAFMRVAMLLNPIMHPLNVGASWTVDKGATGFLPHNWMRIARTGLKATKAVWTQNDDFLHALDVGAPLQSQREATAKITQLFFDQLGENLQKKEFFTLRIAKALGFTSDSLLKCLHEFSSKAAWITNDVLFLQAAYERQAGGMDLKTALNEVARTIPDYRLPAHILNSRLISKVMESKWATIFGAYHYGLLKGFAETAKSALGMNEAPAGGDRTRDVADAWNRLAMLGLIVFALYPFLDKLAQKITNDVHGRAKRFGPFAVIDAWRAAMQHRKTVGEALQTSVTPAPQTKAAAELVMNRQFYSGRQIYNPHDDWKTQGEQLMRYLMAEGGQLGQAYQSAESQSRWRKFKLEQVGIQLKPTRAEKVAQDIARSKSGSQAPEPGQAEQYAERHDIIDALRQGDDSLLEKSLDRGDISPEQARQLRKRADREPLEDRVYGFTYNEVLKVLDAARADKSQDEIDTLERVLARKRRNMWRRHEQVPAANE